MKKSKVSILTIGCIAAFLMLAINSFSAPESDDDLYSKHNIFNKMLYKGGRGLTNIFTGWAEIPKKMSRTWREKGDPVTGFFVGGATGLGMALVRTATGFYDFFTFPIPFPKDYKSIIEPEFIVPSIWNEGLPFMDKDF